MLFTLYIVVVHFKIHCLKRIHILIRKISNIVSGSIEISIKHGRVGQMMRATKIIVVSTCRKVCCREVFVQTSELAVIAGR